ncbi:hypothetical protein TSUD_86130 [Trifolium subterraneum]|uniref:Uncharacterized protein n=1 Tax=Trifolium subterraneum TaxID=3900 RepID=A0A2Z6PDQ0_TRISU|nr:hypothetical protein TSUD_86130 [Trifolium subterraneum]
MYSTTVSTFHDISDIDSSDLSGEESESSELRCDYGQSEDLQNSDSDSELETENVPDKGLNSSHPLLHLFKYSMLFA